MSRYELFINAMSQTNNFMVQMFLFALLAVIAYPVLDWTPALIRRPAKYIYLAFLLVAFIFTTVYLRDL